MDHVPHNPDSLRPRQVNRWWNRGWRLLDVDEITSRPAPSDQIENWLTGARRWDRGYYGHDATLTYRTRLTREQLAVVFIP